MSQFSSSTPVVRGAQVTMEDGGRLNAFATEPRMQVVEAEQGWGFHDRAEKLNGRMAMPPARKIRIRASVGMSAPTGSSQEWLLP